MSTNRIYAFEHGPFLVRGHLSPSGIQVLRDQAEVARLDAHSNAPVSMSRDGRLAWSDAYGRFLTLALGAGEPTRSAVKGRGVLHPDGRRAFLYRSEEDAGEARPSGLLAADLETGAEEVVWRGSLDPPRLLTPFGAERGAKPPPIPGFPSFLPEVVLAADGATWALVDCERVAIGRGRALLASVEIATPDGFYPRNALFDGDSLYVAGRPGIARLGLDGEVRAAWKAEAPVAGPVARWGADLVAALVVEDRYPGRPSKLEVWRFDPETLARRGRLDGMPSLREVDVRCALLPLQDGGLAWLPASAPVVIWPAPASARRTTSHVTVVGDEPPPAVPHPAEPWYDRAIGTEGALEHLAAATPGARRSLARLLLEHLDDPPRFSRLLDLDIDAFAPYREVVLAWDDARLERLENLDRAGYWLVSRGAPDAASLALAARIRPGIPEGDERRARLLLGIGTPRALALAGDLARAEPEMRGICESTQHDVPAEGPVEPRYVARAVEILKERIYARRVRRGEPPPPPPEAPPLPEGLAPGLPADRVLEDPRGWTCGAPLRHVLSVSLRLIPGDPLAGSPLAAFPFVACACEACDEPVKYDGYELEQAGAGRVRVTGLFGRPDPRGETCPGQAPPPSPQAPSRVSLVPSASEPPGGGSVVGRLGGLPRWWQQPNAPYCRGCGRLMFFVGHLAAGSFRDDLPDLGLFAFACERCPFAVQVQQIT